MSKLMVLEAEHSADELKEHTEFRALKSQSEELASQLREEVDDLESIVRTHQEIARGSDATP